MTDPELENFERQLRRTRPARLPEDFSARLRAAEPEAKAGAASAPGGPPARNFLRTLQRSLRWLVPAMAAAALVMVAGHGSRPFANRPASLAAGSKMGIRAAGPLLRADDVKIDQRLVSSFDAVARLPGGEPVRFRCENWMDQTVVSDKSRGLVVENSRPRFEVVPVGFETY